MEIKDLQPRQGDIDVVVEIVDKSEIREFQKFGRTGRVCTATVKDSSGEIKLSLWNEQIEQVNVGDKVHITNGYVREFQGEKQLTTGRLGKLEVVEKAEKQEKVDTESKESTESLPEEPIDDEESVVKEEEEIK